MAAATAAVAAAAMTNSASSVKPPMKSTGGAAAGEPAPAKIMIEPAVTVMSEHIRIRPPDTPVEARTVVIIVVIRPVPIRPAVAIIAVTAATGQNSKQHQAHSQPPHATQSLMSVHVNVPPRSDSTLSPPAIIPSIVHHSSVPREDRLCLPI